MACIVACLCFENIGGGGGIHILWRKCGCDNTMYRICHGSVRTMYCIVCHGSVSYNYNEQL